MKEFMMSSLANRKYSISEYFEMEHTSGIRHEYRLGEIFEMPESSQNHDHIAGNIFNILKAWFEPQGCITFLGNMRVRVNDAYYVYPDVVVLCGGAEWGRGITLMNPTLIFEVLSETTENFDQSRKFRR